MDGILDIQDPTPVLSTEQLAKEYLKEIQDCSLADSEAIRLVLRDIAEIGKHKVVAEAIDGIDALEKFDAVKPDVLLLDMSMPKKDGMETLVEIRKHNPKAKVVMITAHNDVDLIENCIKLEEVDLLKK